MRRSLEWHPVAVRDLRDIHSRTAARIDAAVMRFAATGEGQLERLSGDPRQIRLRIPGAVALLYIAPETIHVARVFADRR